MLIGFYGSVLACVRDFYVILYDACDISSVLKGSTGQFLVFLGVSRPVFT